MGEGEYIYPSHVSSFGIIDPESYRLKGPHIGHKMHLCEMAAEGRVTLEQMKSMVKDAKFICKNCGRAAAREENLCDPVPL
jgi:hypothetical protein